MVSDPPNTPLDSDDLDALFNPSDSTPLASHLDQLTATTTDKLRAHFNASQDDSITPVPQPPSVSPLPLDLSCLIDPPFSPASLRSRPPEPKSKPKPTVDTVTSDVTPPSNSSSFTPPTLSPTSDSDLLKKKDRPSPSPSPTLASIPKDAKETPTPVSPSVNEPSDSKESGPAKPKKVKRVFGERLEQGLKERQQKIEDIFKDKGKLT